MWPDSNADSRLTPELLFLIFMLFPLSPFRRESAMIWFSWDTCWVTSTLFRALGEGLVTDQGWKNSLSLRVKLTCGHCIIICYIKRKDASRNAVTSTGKLFQNSSTLTISIDRSSPEEPKRWVWNSLVFWFFFFFV